MDLDIVFAFDGKCDKTFVFCGLDYRFLRLDLFLKKIRGRFFYRRFAFGNRLARPSLSKYRSCSLRNVISEGLTRMSRTTVF